MRFPNRLHPVARASRSPPAYRLARVPARLSSAAPLSRGTGMLPVSSTPVAHRGPVAPGVPTCPCVPRVANFSAFLPDSLCKSTFEMSLPWGGHCEPTPIVAAGGYPVGRSPHACLIYPLIIAALENGPQRRGKWAAEAQRAQRRNGERVHGEQAGGMLPRFAWKHGTRQIPYEIKVT
jgi:hypothetical protein